MRPTCRLAGVVAALLLMVAGGVHAQAATIPAGEQSSPILGGLLLRPVVDTMIATVSAGSRTDTIGIGLQTLERTATAGRQTWLQVYRWFGVGGDRSVDSLEMDAETLLPVRQARHTDLGSVVLTYNDGEVLGAIRRTGGDSTVRLRIAPGVYSSSALDPVMRTLPLQLGFSQEAAFYYPFPAQLGVRTVRVAVTGEGIVAARDGTPTPSWIVTAYLPGGETRLWVSKATRAAVKMEAGEGEALIQFSFE